jgi:23S rRNA (uridine2552-2'-O)-methyltransferase
MRSPRKDARYKRAKAAGYRARSAYKLIDLDDRYRFLGRGTRIVDVGAWPGGWLQVAAERSRRDAVLVGVDLEEIAPLPDPRVRRIVGDVTDPDVVASIRDELGGPADVVLSDAAPKLTGVGAADQARLEELGLGVVEAAAALLRPGGCLVMKVFSGEAGDTVRRAAGSRFRTVKTTRPEATRRGSSEMYLVATDLRVTSVDK